MRTTPTFIILSALPLLFAVSASASSARDFDFLLGKRWKVHNRVLQERLVGSTEWTEFEATLEKVQPIVGGLGNFDSFKAVLEGEAFEGNSLRLFDPETGDWTIYWVDSRNPKLREQVVGRFENGLGEFFGEETYRGKTVEMRFRWSVASPRSARWEQAYLDETNGSWETNWIMEFTAER